MSAKQRLTRALIERAEPPATGSRYLWDSEVRGLAVRIRASKDAKRTTRVYAYRHHVNGRDTWQTIGEHGYPHTPDPKTGAPRTLTLDVAREEAGALRSMRKAGIDPAAQRRTEMAKGGSSISVADFADEYLKRWAPPHITDGHWRKNREHVIRKSTGVVALLGALRMDEVGPRQINDVQTKLASTPVMANRVLALLSHMFTMARAWEFLPAGHVNPTADVKKFKEAKSERYLSSDELRRLGAALQAERALRPREVDAVVLMAMTGARPTEVLTLLRSEEDMARGMVMVTRKGRRMPVHLPPGVVAIMRMQKAKPLNPYLFPAVKSNGPMTKTGPVRTIWRRVRERAKLTDVRMYDLRHTLASIAVNQGKSLAIVGGMLGHTKTQTSARYAHLTTLTVRTASHEAAAEVSSALNMGRPRKQLTQRASK